MRERRCDADFMMKSAGAKKRRLAKDIQLFALKSLIREHARHADFITKSAGAKKRPLIRHSQLFELDIANYSSYRAHSGSADAMQTSL